MMLFNPGGFFYCWRCKRFTFKERCPICGGEVWTG